MSATTQQKTMTVTLTWDEMQGASELIRLAHQAREILGHPNDEDAQQRWDDATRTAAKLLSQAGDQLL